MLLHALVICTSLVELFPVLGGGLFFTVTSKAAINVLFMADPFFKTWILKFILKSQPISHFYLPHVFHILTFSAYLEIVQYIKKTLSWKISRNYPNLGVPTLWSWVNTLCSPSPP